jgi:hypothetical protein
MDLSLRPELTALPVRIAALPRHRGYPVPWFVAMVNGEPEFRLADARKWDEAIREERCWVCGQKLGQFKAFVLGPIGGVTRSTAEPPCHKECAEWSVMNCSFLVRPQMVRRENDLPGDITCPGEMLKRNPGVSLVWVAVMYQPFKDNQGGVLIEVGEPLQIQAYKAGRPATYAEVMESVNGGMPALVEMANQESTPALREKANKELIESLAVFTKLLRQNLPQEQIAS